MSKICLKLHLISHNASSADDFTNIEPACYFYCNKRVPNRLSKGQVQKFTRHGRIINSWEVFLDLWPLRDSGRTKFHTCMTPKSLQVRLSRLCQIWKSFEKKHTIHHIILVSQLMMNQRLRYLLKLVQPNLVPTETNLLAISNLHDIPNWSTAK